MIAGSSAGAMVLCKYYYDSVSSRVAQGLNLVKHICILPHHNTFGKDWVPRLNNRLSDIILLGIDEETGAISDLAQENWRVYGKGEITFYHDDQVHRFGANETFDLKMV